MAQFPCLPLWTDAWIADTAHLTRCERGTYHDLLVLMWRSPACQVPNDNAWLAKHLRMTLAEVVAELRPLIVEFCTQDGNWVTQKRLKREFVHRFQFSAAQSVRAKSRWRKKKDACPDDAAHGNAHNGNASPSPSPSPNTARPSSTAATTVDNSDGKAEKQPDSPARSFASAPDGGALAREPDSTPAERKRSSEKKPVDMTMAEFNEHWRGNGHSNGFKRP